MHQPFYSQVFYNSFKVYPIFSLAGVVSYNHNRTEAQSRMQHSVLCSYIHSITPLTPPLSLSKRKGPAVPRLLIRKHKKVSKINVFKGREHGTKSKNLILTGTKGADFHISALFLFPRHRQPPYGVFSYPYLYPPEKCIN